MANDLLRGTGPVQMPAPETPSVIPTFGYRSGHEPTIFNLKPGETLPDGWVDSPDKVVEHVRKKRKTDAPDPEEH